MKYPSYSIYFINSSLVVTPGVKPERQMDRHQDIFIPWSPVRAKNGMWCAHRFNMQDHFRMAMKRNGRKMVLLWTYSLVRWQMESTL